MEVYKEPLYYEIAFSFINVKKQIDLFERFIEKYSKIKVKRFLDIGCGQSLQLREIAKRGYRVTGLDSSSQMLKYLENRAKEEGIRIETIKGDMTNFKLEMKADFSFIMMGTINLIESNKKFLLHLDSLANSLKKGGLYLIENIRLYWTSKDLLGAQSWTMERYGIEVKTTYEITLKDTLDQILTDRIRLDVNDHGSKFVFEESQDVKMIFPQEFLSLIELSKKFEFIGWFQRDRMRKLKKASMDNITILRRK
jgi:SAM-dependent methyltransferase